MNIFLAIFSVVFFVGADPCWAYVPPSGFLIKSVARKHVGYRRIRVKSTVMALDKNAQPTGVQFKEVLTYIPSTGTLKSTATDDAGQVLFETVRTDQSADGSLSPSTLLLFESRSGQLVQSLKSLDIPVLSESDLNALPTEEERRAAESERLSRLDRSGTMAIGWVIGKSSAAKGSAAASSQAEPQVWIEKDTFYPLRLIAALRKGDTSLEDVRYAGFRTYNEFPYPKTITALTSDGTPITRSDMLEINVDMSESSKRPTSDASTLSLSSGLNDGWSSAGQSASGSVRDLIRDFYSTLR